MGYSVSRSGFTKFDELVKSIAQDMVNGGFILKYTDDVSGAKAILDPLSMIVYVDGVEAVKNTDYTVQPNDDGTITVLFLDGHVPEADSKVTASYSFIERRTSVPNETLIGKVNGLNTEFVTSKNISSSSEIQLSSLKVKINGVLQRKYIDEGTTPSVPVPQYDYKAELDPTTKKALIHFTKQAIPKDKSVFTADYYTRNGNILQGYNTQPTLDTIDGVRKTFEFNVYNKYGPSEEVFAVHQYNSANVQFKDSTGALCAIQSFVFDNALGLITVTFATAPDPAQMNMAREHFVVYDWYYTSESKNEPLTGNADGYNDIFVTDPKKVKVDQSTFEVSVDVPDGSGGFVNTPQLDGIDYTSTYNADGTITVQFIKIKFDGTTGIPVDGSVVKTAFEYIKSTPSNNVAPLIGLVDGTNAIFHTPVVVFGTKFTLEAGPLVDPLAATQPWRIHLDGSYIEDMQLTYGPRQFSAYGGPSDASVVHPRYTPDVTLTADTLDPTKFLAKTSKVQKFGKIIVGTPIQLPDDGTVATYNLSKKDSDKYGRYVDVVTPGQLYTMLNVDVYTLHATSEVTSQIDTNYIGSDYTVMSNLDINAARPITYTISVSNHGVIVNIKTDAKDAGDGNIWYCIQRLADAKTGEILVEGHSPVVCLFQMQPIDNDSITLVREGQAQPAEIVRVNYEITRKSVMNMIVVRENDVIAPTNPVPVNQNYAYIGGIWNYNKQISLSNKDEYIISIPDGLNTHRHFYPNKRVDMVGFISANVIAEGVDASVSMHGETKPRKYKAQRTTIGYTEGGRMLMLVEGGGV